MNINPFVLALCCCYFGYTGVYVWAEAGSNLMAGITGVVAIITILFYISLASNKIN